MLREDKRLIDDLHIGAAGFLIAAAYSGLYVMMADRVPPLKPWPDYLPSVAILISLILATLSYRKASPIRPLVTPWALLGELALAWAVGALGYGFAAYTLKLQHLSRLYVYGGLLGGYVLTAAWLCAAYAWHHRGGRGRELGRVLLVGEPEALSGIADTIKGRPALGLEVAGTLGPDEKSLSRIGGVLDSCVVDYALFNGDRRNSAAIKKAMLCCQQRGVEIWLTTDLGPELAFSRVDYLEELPVLVFSRRPRAGPALLFKRFFDITASLLLLIVLSPVLFLLALLTRLSGRPALFRQRRIGLNGRKFVLYKFRSMVARSPADGAALRNEMSGPVFKMKEDPRVTPLGRFLRKYSLDELPQLWNVLLGEMSLVGPRPPLPEEVDQYQEWQRRRLSMRPGITGLWQVMGRNNISEFDDWVKLDLRYLDNWSLWLDLQILLKTIPVVIKGTGR